MPNPKARVLQDKHLKTLNEVLDLTQQTEELCDKCASCGLNVDAERAKNREQRDIAMKIKGTFFPSAK